jgi:Glycosyl transferase family 2
VPSCRWLGIDHVFLKDNGSRDYRRARAALTARFPASFLTLRSDTHAKAQLKAYAWCAETQREKYNWLAFFDVDEYLVFRGSAAPADPASPPDVRAFLNEYRATAALAVSWVWVGPSGRQKRAAGGGVLRQYTQCVPKPDGHVKSIVNTWFLDGVAVHPHNFHYRCAPVACPSHRVPVCDGSDAHAAYTYACALW